MGIKCLKKALVSLLLAISLAFGASLLIWSVPARAADDWLVMVYMAADNDLEQFAIDDFLEISASAPAVSDNVRIIVLMDRLPLYDDRFGDWTDTNLFEVNQGCVPQPGTPGWLQSWGEKNTGDPQTLIDFMKYCKDNFPAAGKNMLVLWDHGSGWKTRRFKSPFKGVCWDDTDFMDYLTTAELETALDYWKNHPDMSMGSMNLLGFDACLMAMVEVDYQCAPYCNVRVSSQEVELAGGWPYNTIVADLVANPVMGENEFARIIVDRYYESYGNNWTLSAVDYRAGYADLVESVDSLASHLRANMDRHYFTLWNAASNPQRFYDTTYVDLHHLAKRLKKESVDGGLDDLAQRVMDLVDATVIHERHGANWPGARGISIYFPPAKTDYLPSYDGASGALRFTADTSWDELLVKFLSGNHGNVAASSNGGSVVDSSIEESVTAVIDNSFYGWSCYGATLEGHYITVKLGGNRAYRIKDVYIDPGPIPVFFPNPLAALKEFKLSFSTDGRHFEEVHRGSFSPSQLNRLNRISFGSVYKVASHVKLTVISAQDPASPFLDISEIQVYGTPSYPPSISRLSPASGPAGTDVTIRGAHFGSKRGSSYVRFGHKKVSEYTKWSDTRIKVRVPQGVYGNVPVTVTTKDGKSNSKSFTVVQSAWYLAEGSTAWGFSTYITIVNPNPEDLNARVQFMKQDGGIHEEIVGLSAESQTTINPAQFIGSCDFSTRVECIQGRDIAVERTMRWRGAGAPSNGAHSSVGVSAPGRKWHFPEGSSAWGFESWLLVQNPNAGEATCRVTYMVEGEGARTFVKKIPPNRRSSFSMSKDIGEKDASIMVTSDVPVIAERSVYKNSRREGHNSTGATLAALDYYLAEGSTAWGFTTYILIQNPNSDSAEVVLTFVTTDGYEHRIPRLRMPPRSRRTVRVNDYMPGKDFFTHMSSDRPVVAERAVYWGKGSQLGEACHASIGTAGLYRTFYLPDGQSGKGTETWTLVANPNPQDVLVRISYLTPQGHVVSRKEKIPGRSRRTFSMAGHSGLSGRAAIIVTSETPKKRIVAERSMYWNRRGAGTCTVGGHSN